MISKLGYDEVHFACTDPQRGLVPKLPLKQISHHLYGLTQRE